MIAFALRSLAFLSLLPVLSACSLLSLSRPSDGTTSGVAGGRLDGPTCAGVEREEGRMATIMLDATPPEGWQYAGPAPRFDAPVAQRVAALTCVDYVAGFRFLLGDAIEGQDLRDPMVAAQLVVGCGASLDCIGGPPDAELDLEAVYLAGWVAPLVSRVDEHALRAELAAEGVPNDAIEVYLRRLAAAGERLGALPERSQGAPRTVFVELPARLHAERTAYVEQHAESYAAIARAKAMPDPADRVAALEALRTEALQACEGEAWASDLLVLDATTELLYAYLAAGDELGANAEVSVVRDTGLAAAITQAQWDAIVIHRSAKVAYDKAREAGLPEEAARAGTQGIDPHNLPVRLFEAKHPHWEGMLPGSQRRHPRSHVLRAKKVEGDTTVLEFEDVVTSWDERKCSKTGRVERVHADGRVEYEEHCRATGRKKSSREKVDPIRVPTREAKALKKHDHVSVVASGGEGRVVSARRSEDGPRVQIRDVRIGK